MANEQPREPTNATTNGRARQIKIGAVILLVLLIAVGIYWWFFLRNYVSTDDAYAKADSAMISSRIHGTVIKVFVHDNYAVLTGQPLVELDPTDYKVAVDRAKAALDEVTAELKSAEILVPPVHISTSSNVVAAEASLSAAIDAVTQTRHTIVQLQESRAAAAAELVLAARDRKRFAALSATGAGTVRREQQAQTAYDTAKARVNAVDAQIAAQKSALAAATQQVARLRAQLRVVESKRSDVAVQLHKVEALKAKRDLWKADLEAAKLHLSYCMIAAPIDGYVAEKSVQVGDRIQPGQALMAVVPLKEIYVDANYKETDLTDVHVGQPATITADIYPGHTYYGKVAGILAGTGAAFSLIPPENATGNWIKVVQRIPVRILLDKPPSPKYPLRVGASLEVYINIKNKSGPLLLHPTWTEATSKTPREP